MDDIPIRVFPENGIPSAGIIAQSREDRSELVSEIERLTKQRDGLRDALSALLEDHAARMHSEYDGQTEKWQPTSVVLAARAALESAKT